MHGDGAILCTDIKNDDFRGDLAVVAAIVPLVHQFDDPIPGFQAQYRTVFGHYRQLPFDEHARVDDGSLCIARDTPGSTLILKMVISG